MATYDEKLRLASLRRFGILDTPAEQTFDELVQAAARLCAAPISAISLVDADRQWFKAKVGLDVSQTPRDVSFCSHAMHSNDVYVVPDAALDPMFFDNALVTGDPKIRFYAGAPLRAADGAPLGALCVIDTQPRPDGLTADQTALLRTLANQVERQIVLRDTVRDLDLREDRLLSALESAAVGWWDWDIRTDQVIVNEEMAVMFRLPAAEGADGVPMQTLLAHVHPSDLVVINGALEDAIETGSPFSEEVRVTRTDGGICWVAARGRVLKGERFAGMVFDITDRKRAEASLRDADLGREMAMQAANLGRFDHRPFRGDRYYDARALDMMGLDAEESRSIETVMSRVVHPEDRAHMSAALAAAVDPNRAGPLRETFRVIHGRTGELRWITATGRSQFADGLCIRFLGVFEDVTDAKLAEEHRRMLVNELNHRVKNTLAVVVSLVDQSLRNLTDPDAARNDIGGRILALSRAHDILTADSWTAAPIRQIVDQLAASLSLPRERLEISGTPLKLGPKPALQLALALHELATNALKYGALSNDTGKVTIAWGAQDGEGGQMLRMTWAERGGPTVSPPSRSGFGTRLIERATAAAFGGQVVLEYPPVGARWTLTAPLAGLAESGRSEPEILP